MFYPMAYNIEYLLYLLPGIILAMYAQAKVSTAFERYSRVRNSANLTGAQVARLILDKNALRDVKIEQVRGSMTDHYDPQEKILRLSESVYNVPSIAAVSVAAHEVGHALQDADGYKPLHIRSFLVPAAQLGSNISIYLVLLGLFIRSFSFLINIGIALFCVAVLFQLVTLPVEFNASKRAELELADGILPDSELEGTSTVLHAAALTYVASLLTAIGTLLHLLSISKRRD
ncbi:MAG: zinc metallopeptidase [Tissierellia bacterium]|nr:zinc metallopeptidase [Tissierellia bacterium]